MKNSPYPGWAPKMSKVHSFSVLFSVFSGPTRGYSFFLSEFSCFLDSGLFGRSNRTAGTQGKTCQGKGGQKLLSVGGSPCEGSPPPLLPSPPLHSPEVLVESGQCGDVWSVTPLQSTEHRNYDNRQSSDMSTHAAKQEPPSKHILLDLGNIFLEPPTPT